MLKVNNKDIRTTSVEGVTFCCFDGKLYAIQQITIPVFPCTKSTIKTLEQ